MNTHMFLVAVLIASLFLGIQYVESRYVSSKDTSTPPKPYKVLVKDSLVVFGASLVALFVLEQLRPYLGAGTAVGALVNAAAGVEGIKNPPVFVNNPTF